MHTEPAQPPSDLQRLAALNLNLFVALEALLRTRSVTAAARSVGVTQPSMSHSLKQLRELLEDPLLVRAPHGYVTTPRGQALEAPLRAALRELDCLMEREPAFDPSLSQRRFRIATSDYFQVVGLPQLLGRLSQQAPSIELRLLPASAGSAESLLEASIDLCAGSAEQLPIGPGVARSRLFEERFVVIQRRAPQHKRLTLKRYISQPHALVTSDDGPGYVDRVLQAQGLSRHVSLRVPDYAALASVIAESPLVATVPERYARAMSKRYALCVSAPPLPFPAFDVFLAWHERHTADAGLSWLRRLIATQSRD